MASVTATTQQPVQAGPPRSRALIVCLLVAALWAVIGFAIFSPDSSCTDCNVKYVQARSLIRSGFRSMSLAYPGWIFDEHRAGFPFRPPFTLNTPGGIQSIWSSAVIVLQAPFVAVAGFTGLVVLSLLSGAVILWTTMRLSGRADDVGLPIALAFGTCLWYYAVQPWEHAPAIASGMAGLYLATRERRSTLLCGALLVGLAVVLRDEMLLLVPTLVLLVWYAHRRAGAVLLACAAVVSMVLGAGALDFLVYERPPVAHALQAVGALRSAFNTAFPTYAVPAVPAAPFMSLGDRCRVVLHYWLASSVGPTTAIAYLAIVAAAAVLVRWRQWWIAVLVPALIVLAWSVVDLSALVFRPRSLSSLFPLCAFLVFALFPAPALAAEQRRLRWLLLAGSLIWLAIAMLTADTVGGKSFGPRMLLGLIPLLAISAWTGISGFLRAGRESPAARVVGWVGIALVVVSIGLNVCALRAWAGRIGEDHQALEAVRRSPVRFVVADDPFVAQSLMPLYFDKVLLLADNPAVAASLSATLQRAPVSVTLLVSRRRTPGVSLEPYHPVSSQTVGRFTIQQWIR